jgi:hypothetical protein
MQLLPEGDLILQIEPVPLFVEDADVPPGRSVVARAAVKRLGAIPYVGLKRSIARAGLPEVKLP